MLFSVTAINCHLPRDKGYSCDKPEKLVFYYDARIGACQPMLHHGCGGNENKFDSAEKCKQQCVSNKTKAKADPSKKGLVVEECDLLTDAKIPDVAKSCDGGCDLFSVTAINCHLPRDKGYSCDKPEKLVFYYDARIGACQPMLHHGCGGNENKFDSAEKCKQQCISNKTKAKSDPSKNGLVAAITVGQPRSGCAFASPYCVYFALKTDKDSETRQNKTSNLRIEGPEVKFYANHSYLNFPLYFSVEECDLLTDAKIPDVAKSCDAGCDVGYSCNKNNKCCPTKEYICSLPAASGSEAEVLKHYRRYVYQPGLSNCIRFSYFGIGGNFNNFKTYNDCKGFCMGKPK
ncbi:Kunitz/Bovine pancreatic trypsin inhibitor domain protein [Oesophagostomum dentatum]|uniref:Kunitz/Bovine pancreatic trypsin inhibitor domain protein n=1 Tax=Oesophagostomum dentatum TaxID=61180 RepID=A0A0B1TS43_OESDE|nr:Kunitz/Bovine pancreatic trypsin inhibitor domain protein [Oesophagostomum dentatum]